METPETAPTSVLHLDSNALKILAHPLRSRVLSALRAGGPATATALAQYLGTNTGATSYHLRKLESVGIVEETGEGRGRERWWRASTAMHSFTQRDVASDADGQAAADWLRRYYLQSFVERYQAWLDSNQAWPLEWQEAGDASDRLLRLSPAHLMELHAEISALLERFREPDPGDPAARLVEVHVHAFPLGDAHGRESLADSHDQEPRK